MNDIKKKVFYIFLIIQGLLWTIISMTKNIASQDAMEAVVWGDLLSFGTNKHPPLSGWLVGAFHHMLGQNDFAIYLLGEICIIIGLVYVYKLAKNFLSEDKALCSAMILSISFYYTFHTYLNNYNCNIISMALWPIVTYYFYEAIKKNKLKDWVFFGIFTGLSFLAKYQISLLIISFATYLLLCDRKQFKQKGFYLSILSGLIVILPHLIWLYKTDFFSFIYITSRSDVAPGNTPAFLLPFGRIVFPIKFYLNQISSILPCIALYLILAIKEKNIQLKNTEGNLPDKIFLLCVGLLPILILGGTGAVSNSRVIGAWGSTMLSYAGVLLFYFFPIKFSDNTFKYFTKWMYSIVIMWILGVGIFSALQNKYYIAFPKEQVMQYFNTEWQNTTNNAPLKYVGGNPKYTFQFQLYNKPKTTAILETFGHENPWVDHEDILKSGVIIVGDKEKDVIKRTKETVILLPKDYQITSEKYVMDVCNKLGKCKEHEMYYAIIPPAK